jgi:ATP-binding cassette subfamily B protein
MYSCHNIVTTYNGIEETQKQFRDFNETLALTSQRASFIGGVVNPVMSFMGNFGYVAVCIVGALLTLNGTIDFGTIIAFIFYVRLFSNPLNTIAQSITKMQSVVAAAERVFEFMDEKEMIDENSIVEVLPIQNAVGNISFKNVTFAYDEKPVIQGFSVDIKAGQKVAIVGKTGAGKTTLVNLLMKFYDISEGDIKIDGCSIKTLSRSNIHDLFCMVLQNTWLFNGTIKENIIYNQEHISMDEVKEACQMAGISDFIESLPDKYDTVLENTNTLSEGQKQLLTIARAIVDKSPFLILDEATSSVDRKTEEIVQKSMDKLMHNRTSFIIAHRLSTIQNADIILVVDNGQIVEMGNHNELISQNGYYTELYNSQFAT